MHTVHISAIITVTVIVAVVRHQTVLQDFYKISV
jgi:hypothetical protein